MNINRDEILILPDYDTETIVFVLGESEFRLSYLTAVEFSDKLLNTIMAVSSDKE